MATYEYRCTKCAAEFEVRRPMDEANQPASCPACGGEGAKLPSVFASKDGYTLRSRRGPRSGGPAVPARIGGPEHRVARSRDVRCPTWWDRRPNGQRCCGTGEVPELVDGHGLGPCAFGRKGSSPFFPTITPP